MPGKPPLPEDPRRPLVMPQNCGETGINLEDGVEMVSDHDPSHKNFREAPDLLEESKSERST